MTEALSLTPQQVDDLQDLVTQIDTSIALGLVPFVGQAIDIYDTAWAAYDLYDTRNAADEHKEAAYFDIAMALLGWIPGPGDAIKKTLKTVNKSPQRFAPLLLDAVRQALYAAGYKVDPYQFLMNSISEGKMHELVTNAKKVVQGSNVYQRSPAAVQLAMIGGIDLAVSSLPLLVGVVERKVKKWLTHGPRSTASRPGHEASGESHPAPGQSQPAARKDTAQKPPPHQQGNADAHVGKDGKPNPVRAQRGTMNPSQIGQAAFNQLQEILGEHVADYHCHNELGWGKKHGSQAQHDKGEVSPAKLSDGQKLRQLRLAPEIRGVGIDAVWHSKSPKPYAIAEYKARAVPMTANGVRELLKKKEAAQDKNLQPAKRKERSTYRRSQKPGPSTLPQPTPLPQGVPKMSHLWIEQRVKKVRGLKSTVIDDLEDPKNYARHVVLVVTTIGDGLTHSQQMLGGQMDESKHASHATGVMVFGESDRVFTEVPTETEKPSRKPVPQNDRIRTQRGGNEQFFGQAPTAFFERKLF